MVYGGQVPRVMEQWVLNFPLSTSSRLLFLQPSYDSGMKKKYNIEKNKYCNTSFHNMSHDYSVLNFNYIKYVNKLNLSKLYLLNENKWSRTIDILLFVPGITVQPYPSKFPNAKLNNFPSPSQGGKQNHRKGVQVLSPNINSPGLAVEYLDGWDDEYDGIIIDPESLPSSANAFASALKASLFNWKLKVWYVQHMILESASSSY